MTKPHITPYSGMWKIVEDGRFYIGASPSVTLRFAMAAKFNGPEEAHLMAVAGQFDDQGESCADQP